jgi:ABC-type multidrug transport system ATPase subunit
MLLEVRGLGKRFGPNLVLDGVAFSVQQGEVLGLIGPNGAGKTTLFECLAGLIPLDAGSVSPQAGPKRRLFYLPDDVRPWAEQRVHSVLAIFESLYGSSRLSLLEPLRLQPVLRSRMSSLSKGELKRVMLALALLSPQPLLLLDEPFDGLDFRQTRDVMALLRRVQQGGRTLFLSIHQLSDAARVCDRLVLLSAGRIAGIGTLDELRQRAGLAEGGLEEIFLALT